MSVCSASSGAALGMGVLRPFCPGLAPFGVMSPCPISAPGFCPVSQISLVPTLARDVFGFVRIKKTKNSLPRRRAAQPFAPPGQKCFHPCRKSRYALCIAAFSYSFWNAFSYSSMRRFSSAQYRASSSDMSSRLRFCSIARPISSAPARSLLIRW